MAHHRFTNTTSTFNNKVEERISYQFGNRSIQSLHIVSDSDIFCFYVIGNIEVLKIGE